MKVALNSIKVAAFAFIFPARWFFVLIGIMIVAEYVLSSSLKDEKFTIWNAVHKWANFVVLILLGLVTDEAFGFKVSNVPLLTKYGFQNEISAIAYLISILCLYV